MFVRLSAEIKTQLHLKKLTKANRKLTIIIKLCKIRLLKHKCNSANLFKTEKEMRINERLK